MSNAFFETHPASPRPNHKNYIERKSEEESGGIITDGKESLFQRV
jgi:hypothetical protein